MTKKLTSSKINVIFFDPLIIDRSDKISVITNTAFNQNTTFDEIKAQAFESIDNTYDTRTNVFDSIYSIVDTINESTDADEARHYMNIAMQKFIMGARLMHKTDMERYNFDINCLDLPISVITQTILNEAKRITHPMVAALVNKAFDKDRIIKIKLSSNHRNLTVEEYVNDLKSNREYIMTILHSAGTYFFAMSGNVYTPHIPGKDPFYEGINVYTGNRIDGDIMPYYHIASYNSFLNDMKQCLTDETRAVCYEKNIALQKVAKHQSLDSYETMLISEPRSSRENLLRDLYKAPKGYNIELGSLRRQLFNHSEQKVQESDFNFELYKKDIFSVCDTLYDIISKKDLSSSRIDFNPANIDQTIDDFITTFGQEFQEKGLQNKSTSCITIPYNPSDTQ